MCCLFYSFGCSHGVLVAEAYLGGPLGHGPPLTKKFFFDIEKILENLVGALLCMSTCGQRKFGPPFEILNTPLIGCDLALELIACTNVNLLLQNHKSTHK